MTGAQLGMRRGGRHGRRIDALDPGSAQNLSIAHLYVQVITAIIARRLRSDISIRRPAKHEAARRRLHQTDQDGDRADHFCDRGARHRVHARHEKGRPRRRQSADLFRSPDHGRAGDRPDRRQHPAAGRRHEHRAAAIDTKASRAYVAKSKDQSTVGFLLDIIPDDASRRVCGRQYSAGPAGRDFVCVWLQALGDTWRAAAVSSSIRSAHVLFKIVGFIMRLAPIGAFGAMAFTIGKIRHRHAQRASAC